MWLGSLSFWFLFSLFLEVSRFKFWKHFNEINQNSILAHYSYPGPDVIIKEGGREQGQQNNCVTIQLALLLSIHHENLSLHTCNSAQQNCNRLTYLAQLESLHGALLPGDSKIPN